MHYRQVTLILVFILSRLIVFGQEGYELDDKVYSENIKSIRFHLEGVPFSMPILKIQNNSFLELTFDDLALDVKEFKYKIIHCDKDWNESNMTEIYYLSGFNDEEIRDYEYSRGTKIDYTNYKLYLPNDDVDFKISGNYVIVVYERDTKEVVFTRRFIVVEQIVNLKPSSLSPQNVLLNNVQYATGFEVRLGKLPIYRPMTNLFATYIQNGRWDNMVSDVTPDYVAGNVAHFNTNSQVKFDAFKEFRNFDIRGLSRNASVHSVDIYEDDIDVLLQLDRENLGEFIHSQKSLDARRDINGNYLISAFNVRNDELDAEYANVYFNLTLGQYLSNTDIYLFGKFTDWQIEDAYKLKYDAQREVYRTSLLLKQGYYDYDYAFINPLEENKEIKRTGQSNLLIENAYTIVLYYRSIEDRYDRALSFITDNTFNPILSK